MYLGFKNDYSYWLILIFNNEYNHQNKKNKKYLQSRKHPTSPCHPDDRGSECKPLNHSDKERIPIINITDSIGVKKEFRAKVNLYTDAKFENIAEIRKLSKRESDEDEYDPWESISPIGNGSYR